MSENPELHQRLIDRQSTEELNRKRDIAVRKKQKMWTQEELDAAQRNGKEMRLGLEEAAKGNDYY